MNLTPQSDDRKADAQRDERLLAYAKRKGLTWCHRCRCMVDARHGETVAFVCPACGSGVPYDHSSRAEDRRAEQGEPLCDPCWRRLNEALPTWTVTGRLAS